MPTMCAIPQLVSVRLNPIPIVYSILGIAVQKKNYNLRNLSVHKQYSLPEKPRYDSKLNTSLELLEINHKMK